jgi:hypothetical protein
VNSSARLTPISLKQEVGHWKRLAARSYSPEQKVTRVSRTVRLSHGWKLTVPEQIASSVVREFIRPAIRAVPAPMAHQMGFCHIFLLVDLNGPDLDSQWTRNEGELKISIAVRDRDPHDVTLELLSCLGQALWEVLLPAQAKKYWLLLNSEFLAGITGEIDEDAVREKRVLLGTRLSAASPRLLERYGRSSFAGTAAEYVHCLWHDVQVVSGPDHLPPRQLRRRLDLLARWFPPNRGQRLYP